MSSWWESDTYDQEAAVPLQLADTFSGPKGRALVKVWPSGATQDGWGLQGKKGADGFMPRYMRDEFNERRALYGYARDKWAFAYVMRSVSLLCVDIDGKNGGLEHAVELGLTTATLAETSKSGNGYHLFYRTDDVWDPTTGFGRFNDVIGIVQGVDIRGTGCVYHYPSQRWNSRVPAALPTFLADKLTAREQKRQTTAARIAAVSTLDETEKIMMHDELITELKKPIGAGKRNTTLFAIGSQMRQADVPKWDELLLERAQQVGLGTGEAEKIVANIEAYA